MNNKFEDIIIEAKTVVLPSEDKAVLRAAIERHMMANPIGVMNSEVARHGIRSGYMSMLLPRLRTFLNQRTNPMPALTIIAALLLSGSVSYASQDSLPGDTLYPFKRATEEVQSAVTIGAEADARLDAHLAVKRLQEAEKLSAEGRLDAETEARLEADFSDNTDKFVKRVSKFVEKDRDAAVHASAEFQGRLDAHANAAPQGFSNGITRALEAIDRNLQSREDRENATSTNATSTEVRGALDIDAQFQKTRSEAKATESEMIKINLDIPVSVEASSTSDSEDEASSSYEVEIDAEVEVDLKKNGRSSSDDEDETKLEASVKGAVDATEEVLIDSSGTLKLGL